MAISTRTSLLTEGDESRYAEIRRTVCRRVLSRSRGVCELCLRDPGQDFHEIRQRNNHIESLRVETGIYSEGNIIYLCRDCHQRTGQTVWGKLAMLWVMYKRYGYPLPPDFHGRSGNEIVAPVGE